MGMLHVLRKLLDALDIQNAKLDNIMSLVSDFSTAVKAALAATPEAQTQAENRRVQAGHQKEKSKMRMLCWFSCGGPSAVASKKAVEHYGQSHEVLIVNCDTRPSEHEDNYRFSKECEAWFGQPIIYLRNEDYATVDEVFEKTGYLSGIRGARCTTELKKIPRLRFASPDDIHVFGYTSGELARADEFSARNPDMRLKWILIELDLSKQDCLFELRQAGIKLPAMYELGFDNNNCPGCVKASSPWYWSMIRKHFPIVFKRRCEQSRKLGVRLVEIHHHERIFLDELPEEDFKKPRRKENLSCGPECGIQTKLIL